MKFTVKDEATGQPVEIDLVNNTRTMRDAGTGRLVTMDLGQADVHIDQALANYAAGYQMAMTGMIADQICPVVPVPKASDYFYTWDKDDVFQLAQSLEVTAGGDVSEISPRLSSTTFATKAFGLQTFVPTELQANQDTPLNIEMAAMRRVLNALLQGREARVATLLTTSGNWTGGYTVTLGATAKWNAGSASDPIKDIFTAIEASLLPVTAVVMSERTWHDFVQNAAVQKYVASKTMVQPLPGVAKATEFSALLGLPPIIIGSLRGKTSGGYGYAFGDHVVLLHTQPGMPSDGQTISTCKTFRWSAADNATPDGTVQGGYLVRSYFDPKRGPRGGRTIVCTHNDAEKMTSVFVGGLIINAHQ